MLLSHRSVNQRRAITFACKACQFLWTGFIALTVTIVLGKCLQWSMLDIQKIEEARVHAELVQPNQIDQPVGLVSDSPSQRI